MSETDPLCTPRSTCPKGYELLQDPMLNKGTSFSEEERRAMKIEGLLPPGFNTIEEQVIRTMENFRKRSKDMEKYDFMMALMERDLTLFHRIVSDHIEEMMPIVYTPTVGRASQEYSHIFQKPQGLFLSARFKGRFAEIIRNWPIEDVRLVVITDGERILGLGDLGVSGMAIPVGKLILYVACAGIRPSWCLPITLDVGTNNVSLLNDPMYLGLRHERIRGTEYDELMEEFIRTVLERYPAALIHFEDFGNRNAFRLLKKYRDQICCFNDDIQGTAAVALAGLYSAAKTKGESLADQKFLFLGAGGAGIGIGELIVSALIREGLSAEDARQRCWFVDSGGLVVRDREKVDDIKVPFAHSHKYLPDMESAVEESKPTAIIGVSGQPGKFTPGVLQRMVRINRHPIVFALSNPTSKSECTAEEAYTWTEGRAVFAGGSPFAPVQFKGKTLIPGQGNNSYIFPGIGLGVIASMSRRITDQMFLAAARTLAENVPKADFEKGCIYPPLKMIREVSAEIALSVAEIAFREGLAGMEMPGDLRQHIRALMYAPVYKSYI